MRKIIFLLTVLMTLGGEMVWTVSAQMNRHSQSRNPPVNDTRPIRNDTRPIRNDTRPIRSVPEPATILLVGSGLIGIAAWRKWKNRA